MNWRAPAALAGLLMAAGCTAAPTWRPIGVGGDLAAAQTICQAEKQKAYMTSREGLTVFTFSRLDDVYAGCMAEHGFTQG